MEYANHSIGAIVLAGGHGTRFGSFKPMHVVLGRTLLEHLLTEIRPLYREIIIVTGTEHQKEQIQPHTNGLTVVTDRISGVGPLGGILTGTLRSSTEYCQILPADSPAPKRSVLNFLASCVNGYDAVVPAWHDGRVEQLHGVYNAKIAAKESEFLISKGEYAVISLVRSLKAHFVSVEELQELDQGLETFLNVNMRGDLDKIARALADRH